MKRGSSPEHGFDQLIGEEPVQLSCGVIEGVCQQLRGIDTGFFHGLPHPIHIAEGGIGFAGDGSGGIHIPVEGSAMHDFRELLRQAHEEGIAAMGAGMEAHGIGGHEDDLAVRRPQLFDNGGQTVVIAGQTVATAAGIVESEADDGEIGVIRQHIALEAGQTACGVIPADACADHIDLGAREEGMEDRFDLMGIAVFGFKDGIKTVFADA